tara:strand:+ start:114 stop:296 length:183 start_codon:yes stop_codon:yes gene_type:complete
LEKEVLEDQVVMEEMEQILYFLLSSLLGVEAAERDLVMPDKMGGLVVGLLTEMVKMAVQL